MRKRGQIRASVRWEEAGIDCAVPRDKPVVAINVRLGVEEDRAKRIKDFAAELKEVKECGVKYFIVAYLVPEHEKGSLRR